MSEPAPLFSAEGLRRRYGERVAIDGLSFSVARGEIFGFLGPNGAGKTTTFEILSGLRAPDAGRLYWLGRPIAATSPELRSRLGVVFQKPALDDKLSARENLALAGALYGVTGAVLRPRLEAALVDAELGDRADEPVSRYSGGMRRRLELARVLLHQPELLVLDEPTQGLDPGFRRAFWRRIDEVRKARKLAVLLTTHDPDEAERCDRLLVLHRGKIIAEGSPDELKQRVGGEVLTVWGDDPAGLADLLREKLALAADIKDDHVVLPPRPGCHALVPRLVEALPVGRVRSIAVRAPSLSDVFVKLTGRDLSEAEA